MVPARIGLAGRLKAAAFHYTMSFAGSRPYLVIVINLLALAVAALLARTFIRAARART